LRRPYKEKNKRKLFPFFVLLCILCGSVFGTAYAGTEANAGIAGAKLADAYVEWEEIPELVRRGNPVWKELSSDVAREKDSTYAACEAFRAELYENVDLIDESLDEIRMRKSELKELPRTQTVDASGTTVAQEITKQEAAEKMLREQRRQIIRAVGSVIVPAKDAIRKAEEGIEPEFESIVQGVRETVIARQQLLSERDAFAAETELARAKAAAAGARYARGMVSETAREEAEMRAAEAEKSLARLDDSLKKITRSLNRSLGFDSDAEVSYGPVPAPEKDFRTGLTRESELKKLYAGNKELKDLTDPKSFGTYGSQNLWQAAINEAKAELTSAWDSAWEDLLTAEDACAEASAAYADAKKASEQAENRYAAGKISSLSLLEASVAEKEAEAALSSASLSLRKAQEQYRNTCTPTDR